MLEFIVLITAVVTALVFLNKQKNRNTRWSRKKPSLSTPPPKEEPWEIQCIKLANTADFTKKHLLNKEEQTVYWHLVNILKNHFIVHAQVSLGEVLSAEGSAHRAINSKRVDFLLTDKQFSPVAAIEYHGGGHYQGNAELRDSVKRTTLQKAGIKYIPIQVTDEASIKQLLMRHGVLENNEPYNNKQNGVAA